MTACASPMTVGEALLSFYAANGLDMDQTRAGTWRCGIGPLEVRLTNYAWRRRAILRHDLHHVLTGYACSLSGEFEMAAWEFGAGRYPAIGATLFCLPLVAIGAGWSPRRSFRAFRRGRGGRTLYGVPAIDVVLSQPLGIAQAAWAPAAPAAVRVGDIVAFGRTVVQSLLVIAAPILIGALLLALG